MTHQQHTVVVVDLREARVEGECAFDLELVAPNLPPFPCPPGHDEMSWLREVTEQGARRRRALPARAPSRAEV